MQVGISTMLKTSSCSGSCEQGMLMVMVVRDHSLTTFYKLHKVMGLTEDNMIAPMDVKRGKMLLYDILNEGNFGHYDKHHVLGHNLLRLYRDARLLRYYPAEALSEPMFRTWHILWRLKFQKK